MGKVVFLSNTDTYYASLKKAANALQAEKRLPGTGEACWVADETGWDAAWEKKLTDCNVVIIEWMGVSLDVPFLQGALTFFHRQGMSFKIHAGDGEEGNAACGFEPGDHVMVARYGVYGGRENFENLWLWAFARFCNAGCSYEQPAPTLWNGIYHPRANKVYTDLAEYEQDFCRAGRPTIGFLFYRNEWLLDNLAYQQAIIAECERQNINIIPVFSHGVPSPEMEAPGLETAIRKYFLRDGRAVIDVLINTLKFSLTASGSLKPAVLKELNVPLLQAYTLMTPTGVWQESVQGMTAVEISISITMPEFDGAVHSTPVAGKYRDRDNVICYEPMPERIELLVRKAVKWAVLRRKPNKDKRVAIIFHNYPPKNSNIGTALGMDSPESVRLLLAALQAQSYGVDHIPEDSKTFMAEVVRCATNDRRFMNDAQIEQAIGKVSPDDYAELFAKLSDTIKEKMTEGWGNPPGEVFNYDGRLLIPGMPNGNVIVTVQPPRGFGEAAGKIYHDPVSPPTHHYLAFYYWLRQIWQADAVVHVGTHGSVEWLPGKAAGLSPDCYPDICIGDLPNVYHFLVTIIGEGVQAKRRSAACLVDYLTPPMSTAGVYEELAELESLLDEYLDFQDSDGDTLDSVKRLIREKAAAANLDKEIEECGDFAEYAGKLHNYVTDIKHMQIRVGLHTLGLAPQGAVLREYLLALTRIENGSVPSLAKVLALRYGYDYYELIGDSAKKAAGLGMTYGRLVDRIQRESTEIIEYLMAADFNAEVVDELLHLQDYGKMPAELQADFLCVCRYICTELAPNLGKTAQELTNTLRALNGEFIDPTVAGAPTNGRADVLPTGRNFYGIDPQTLPTRVAWETAQKTADGVINQFIVDEGRYPESIGMVLGSNMRTHGQGIAQFMYLLGIRPVWQKGSGRVVGLEPIPLEELKRPRIDATGRVTGMLRDSMPCTVVWMDKAAKLAASLDEPLSVNYIRKHVLEDAMYLEEQGAGREEAWEQASYRLFGCPPGGYGAGVANLLEEKNWETIDDLAQVYVRWGAHVYGENENGAYRPELFKRRLSSLDATILGVDNREINLLSSDDFNSYHGGMIASVRSFSGKAPRAYCADSTDKSHVVIRSVAAEVKRVFRGEIMNPKFIEGMKEHGYKGAADLANYVAHSYQWDATSDVMEDWMYEKFAEKYALDSELRQWMQEINPWALQRIAETLLEANQRGLWQAGKETLKELEQLYLSIDGDLEERSDS